MMSVANNGWGVFIESNKVKLSKVGVSECASKSTIADTNWHHIAVTHNGTIATFYIDGKADTSITYSNTFTSTGSYTIGSRGNSQFFEGRIDEVRVWNKVKASTDINTQRCIAISVNESNLRAYYKFEEGTGTAIIDSTSNVNHGTISNGTNLWVSSSGQCATSGIFEKELLDMGIFATTFNKAIQINIPENVDLTSNNEIHIYNIAGTLIYQGLINPSNRAYTVQSNEFSNGLYIVHVQTATNGIYINKVMISE
ncbi:MAG: T9SS type A sorting domain-containing protein [Bacteroidetes bacterium]|nr:T9SS type A sorting domain-containing protein [Bacteroidota bacterium]